jgi:hypothetical protein
LTGERVTFRRQLEQMMRDDFPLAIKDTLAKRVAQRCSNPGCKKPTSGPQDDPTKAVNLGVAAHIAAAAPGGPRYDSAMTPEQRCSPDNGIWLCQNCAKLIDNDPSEYTTEIVRAWRILAEAIAKRSLEQRRDPDDDAPFIRLERMMPEFLSEMRRDLQEHPLRREFVLLKKGWMFNTRTPTLAYYYDDHPNLDDLIRILQNHGVIQDITHTNVKRYVMDERLVDYLTADATSPI